MQRVVPDVLAGALATRRNGTRNIARAGSTRGAARGGHDLYMPRPVSNLVVRKSLSSGIVTSYTSRRAAAGGAPTPQRLEASLATIAGVS
jgi:hypothetical protein